MNDVKATAERIIANREAPEYLMSDARALAKWALPLLDETSPTFDAAKQLLANSACCLVGYDGKIFVSLPDDLRVTSLGQLRQLCNAITSPLTKARPT